MLDYTVYKLIHFIGIFMVYLAFGGLLVNALVGGDRQTPGRKVSAITHGVGLFLVLLGGFGLLARMAIHWPWPGWIMVKVAIWLIFGGLIALIARKPGMSKAVWWLTLVLGIVAAYMAINKPF